MSGLQAKAVCQSDGSQLSGTDKETVQTTQ